MDIPRVNALRSAKGKAQTTCHVISKHTVNQLNRYIPPRREHEYEVLSFGSRCHCNRHGMNGEKANMCTSSVFSDTHKNYCSSKDTVATFRRASHKGRVRIVTKSGDLRIEIETTQMFQFQSVDHPTWSPSSPVIYEMHT